MSSESLAVIEPLLNELPNLNTIVLIDNESPQACSGREVLSFWNSVNAASDILTPVKTSADDPAIIIYTSGTTGNPKGALHAHRYLLGHLPAVELSHDFFPQEGDLFWTPADWAWIGGLINALFSSLHHGVPVVGCASRGRFDPEQAFALMEKYGVRNAFLPPTALRMMAQAPDVGTRYKLKLRSIMSGGESLGSQTLDWARDTLGVHINEIYGQTEINLVIGNCASLWEVRPGSMGRTYPGHDVVVVDERGSPLPRGQTGELAVYRGDDPVFFLGYWNNPQATGEKYIGDWALTGDLALQDEDGYFWFKGRTDDVIISAGHRIGPTEVENALMRHPSVAMAAVVAAPDELRGHVVKAFVTLAAGAAPSELLAGEIQTFVKETLAMHEYPRKIEFIDELPLTPTGKVRRNVLRDREVSSE
jgi:acetyl-CoA synthetase